MILASAFVLNNPSIVLGRILFSQGNSQYLLRKTSSNADSSRLHVCTAFRGAQVTM
jgi:hypothetical protein